MIMCENIFCVYEQDGKCGLKQVELDIQGQCKECIYVNVDAQTLDMLKKQKRQQWEEDG